MEQIRAQPKPTTRPRPTGEADTYLSPSGKPQRY